MSLDSSRRSPVLRFRDSLGKKYPDWIQYFLGDCVKFSKGRGISKEEIVDDGKLKCIRYGELYTHYGEVISSVVSATNVCASTLVFSKQNDVIIPASGETALDIVSASCVLLDNVALGGDINIIRSEQNGVFLAYCLNQKRKDISRFAQGISVIHLYATGLRRLQLSLPCIEEQQKIADFLSSVDTRIEQLEKKKSLLEQYKKGLMQKLFSKEIRFKDDEGEEYPEWEISKLGKHTTTRNGESNREDSYEVGEYAFFDRSQDIRASTKYIFDGEAIIVAGEGKEFLPKYYVGKFDLHQRSYAIMNFQGVSAMFVFYSLTHNRNYFPSVAVGSTMKSLRLPMFIEMPIRLPYYREQNKIANILSSVDNKIELVAEHITHTRMFKKGLLQQMFV
ncbi:MAG: restriction endonuclease subunit S [Acidiferrobacterales bacterium]|nr:restriction endonuclease subunit S [Acidiferrobacterales bacterium]